MPRYTQEQIETNVQMKDGWAYWYAFGRLDQGHPPVVGETATAKPNTTYTAYRFGQMYAAQERMVMEAANAGQGSFSWGLPAAWEHFVASEGAALDSPQQVARMVAEAEQEQA